MKERDELLKAREERVSNILHSFHDSVDVEKGRAAQIGEVREWNGQKYRKESNGKWSPVVEGGASNKKESGAKEGDSKDSKSSNEPPHPPLKAGDHVATTSSGKHVVLSKNNADFDEKTKGHSLEDLKEAQKLSKERYFAHRKWYEDNYDNPNVSEKKKEEHRKTYYALGNHDNRYDKAIEKLTKTPDQASHDKLISDARKLEGSIKRRTEDHMNFGSLSKKQLANLDADKDKLKEMNAQIKAGTVKKSLEDELTDNFNTIKSNIIKGF